MAKLRTVAVLSLAQSIYEKIHGWAVDGGPGQPGPLLSGAAARILSANVIRELSSHMSDKKLAQSTLAMGRDLMQHGTRELVAGYEDGDGICPDFHWPFPWPHNWKFDLDQDLLARVAPEAMDKLLAGAAKRLADTAEQHSVRVLTTAG